MFEYFYYCFVVVFAFKLQKTTTNIFIGNIPDRRIVKRKIENV